MPMIVDPSAPHVTPPTVVTSPDGWLSAVVDDPWAGVLLGYNADTPPSVRNLVLNPSAEVDLTNMVSLGPNISRTRATSDARFGTASVQCSHTSATASQAGNLWMISPQGAGTVLRSSVWVKVVSGAPATGYMAFRAGTANPIQVPIAAVPAAGVWTRLDATYTVAAGETIDRVGLALNGSTGTVWLADGVMCEAGATLNSYIDGDQPDCAWEGTAHASPSVKLTALTAVDDVMKVRIVRQDPGAATPVPVRSADTAWAIEGVGAAYDHEAPLGVAVVYTATPVYADGSEGPPSALAVTVPEPTPTADVWIKSLDEPGLSARVTVVSWPELQWTSRIDSTDVAGSPYQATSQDVYASAGSTITMDAEGDQIEILRTLLTTPGVRLIQTRTANRRPDQFVLFANPSEAVDASPDGARTFTATVQQVQRPDTTGQPLRIPGWSYDTLAASYGSYDAAAATFSSYLQLATNGRLG